MRMYDLIMKKRNGGTLSRDEIFFMIEGYTKGNIPDYQMSAMMMAIYFNGMNEKETAALTMAMAESGDQLDLSGIQGIKVDKHSTGGVGDKTSLALTPMVSACGVKIAKMSGRGLGHTGGTIDKLESFQGFSTSLSEEAFIDQVNRIGISIIGQTKNLAPADKKLYALRDVSLHVEKYPLVEALGGQVIHISSISRDYINPMDINLNYADDDNPLGMKSDFILSLCELIMGARDGMEPEEKSVIDRCLPLVYQKYLNDPKPENMPILGDLYDCLREQKERQAQRIATALEIYVNGSLRVFNHQTNVELDNRLICFDIKELGKQLKKLGMLIVQDQVWNRVTINRNAKKNTRYYIDEFHLLLKEEQTAAYSVEIWKRFRKWGGIPTGITQNIKDLLASREIENIFENSDFIYMLNQASGDRQILAKQLNISPFQLSYVTNSNEGEGLLFYGNTIIPFKDKFDTSLKLYGLMTTKPNEIAKYREKKDA